MRAVKPLGFIALEAGWVVTEVGRQLWTVYGLMRTADAVTLVADVPGSLLLFTALYLGLGIALGALLLRLAGQGLPAAGATAVPKTEVAHAS